MSRKFFRLPRITLVVTLALGLLLTMVAVAAANEGEPLGKARAVAALGVAKIQGQDVLVEVFVVVPPGENADEVARSALWRQGARPLDSANLGSEGFTLTHISQISRVGAS